MEKYFAESELIINKDGSIFHLHVTPEHLADKVILVGDPGRVALVASHFDTKECDIESREFHTITGTYKEKRITVISTGIGCVQNAQPAQAKITQETRSEAAAMVLSSIKFLHFSQIVVLYSVFSRKTRQNTEQRVFSQGTGNWDNQLL